MNADHHAYPIVETSEFGVQCVNYGLTRRELFAAMVMQGVISSDDWDWRNPASSAEICVRFADALMAELDK